MEIQRMVVYGVLFQVIFTLCTNTIWHKFIEVVSWQLFAVFVVCWLWPRYLGNSCECALNMIVPLLGNLGGLDLYRIGSCSDSNQRLYLEIFILLLGILKNNVKFQSFLGKNSKTIVSSFKSFNLHSNLHQFILIVKIFILREKLVFTE